MKASSRQEKAAIAAALVAEGDQFEESGAGHNLVVAELMDAPAGAAVAVPAPDQILTIEPEQYVTAVFQPFEDRLADALATMRVTPRFDVKTAAGMDTAKKLCNLFTKIRTDSERAREERKAPFLNMGRLIDARCKQIKSAVSKHEDKLAALIEAEETRRADEQAALVKAEQEKVAAIEKKIAQIRSAPGMAVGQSITNIATLIARLKACVIDEEGYGDYVAIATEAKDAALVALEAAHAAQVEAERNKAELERLRAQLSAAAPAARPAPPAFDDEPEAPVQAAPAPVAAARARPAPAAVPTPLDALAACHAVLTGLSNARGDAIRAAEAVLRAHGRLN
ncbi:MAG: hypothetical protein ACXWVD_00525 [Telluria sp.]